nr:MAG TPA: hypothetical protein [Bacteriophage sp.]
MCSKVKLSKVGKFVAPTRHMTKRDVADATATG